MPSPAASATDAPPAAALPTTVIAGFDGSERARDGLALAALLARVSGARLIAVGAYRFQPAHREGDDEIEALLAADTSERLAGAAELVDDPAPQLRTLAGHSVPEALQRFAEATPGALLVLGSSRSGAVGRAVVGSVPERVLHAAPCPVAIAPSGYAEHPRGQALKTIGVGFDGGPESLAALASAAALARAAGARLEVITVFDPHISWATPRIVAELEYASYLAEGRDALARRQQEAVAALGAVDATAVALEGEEAEALTERSEALDLLVLGSRCYGPLRRVLLGSVSTQLVRRGHCPLLVLPRSAAAQPGRGDLRTESMTGPSPGPVAPAPS